MAAKSDSQRHVDYVLLSEFDIDKGSTVRAQYPRATGVAENILAEQMLPEGAHLRDTDFTVFFLDFDTLEDFTPPARHLSDSDETETYDKLFCLNIVRTKMDSSVRRGAIVKAMAVCSRHRYIDVFQELLLLALDEYYKSKDLDVLKQVFDSINALDLSQIQRPQGVHLRVFRAARLRKQNQASGSDEMSVNAALTFKDTRIPIKVPVVLAPDEAGEARVSSLVALFGKSVMTIFTALFCEKRVLFLGHNLPARKVSNAVLSACLLISPPLTGTLARAFPYANLTNLDFLQVPGFIAGVTNPIFEQRTEWWDVLCDLRQAKVTLSAAYEAEIQQGNAATMRQAGAGVNTGSSSSVTESMDAMDSSAENKLEKLQEIEQHTVAKIIAGVNLKYSEEWTRSMFRDYTAHLVAMANDEEVFKDRATRQRELDANVTRISLFLASNQYRRHQELARARMDQSAFGDKHSTVQKAIRTLQVRRVHDDQMLRLFQLLLRYVRSEGELLEMLALLPDSRSGIFPLAVNLFHAHASVRRAAVMLLQRLDSIPDGKAAVSALNYFLLLTYHRICREMEETHADAAAAGVHPRLAQLGGARGVLGVARRDSYDSLGPQPRDADEEEEEEEEEE